MRSGMYVNEVGQALPDAPHLVFVHGTRDTSESFEALIPLLPGTHVTLYDRGGWGRSALADPAPRTLADHTEDLESIVGERRVTLVGHSIGAVVAMHFAAVRPGSVVSLALYEPAVHWATWWSGEDNAPIREALEEVRVACANSGGSANGERTVENAEQEAYLCDLESVMCPAFDFSLV